MFRTPKHYIVYQHIMPNRFDKVNANRKRADDEKPASEFTRSQPCRFFDSDRFSGPRCIYGVFRDAFTAALGDGALAGALPLL
jgi:hypothetical protein